MLLWFGYLLISLFFKKIWRDRFVCIEENFLESKKVFPIQRNYFYNSKKLFSEFYFSQKWLMGSEICNKEHS